MLIRPQPQPIAYRLPPRAQVVQAPPAPVYQPIVQPPAVVAPPPPQLPPPQVLYQPQPRAVVPAMAATAPIVAPAYGTYETIVPGVIGGAEGVGVGVRGVGGVGGVGRVGVAGGGAVISGVGARPYSVASIYDDQSVVSIYERENYDVASIYDDRSITSIDGVGAIPVGYAGGPVGYAGGPVGYTGVGGHPYMADGGVGVPGGMIGGRALPGMAFGRHLVSAAHVPRETDEAQRARHIESSDFVDHDQSIVEYNRHGRDAAPLSLPRYRSAEDIDKPVGGRHVFKEPLMDQDYRRDYSDDRMEVDSEIFVENRHVAFPSDYASTETSYQVVQLEEGPAPMQELAIETYYDTTKSQLKVRENQGRLLSEMAFQLKKRQQQDQEKQKEQQQHELQERRGSTPILDQVTPRSSTSPTLDVFPSSQSLQHQNQIKSQNLHQPPTLNIPKPPTNPPPVRLLVNRGVPTPLLQARGVAIPPRSPAHRQSPTLRSHPADTTGDEGITESSDRDGKDSEPILSTSSKNAENIMLLNRNQKNNTTTTAALLSQEAASKARSLISRSTLQSNNPIVGEIGPGARGFERPGLSGVVPAVSTRKARRKQSIPPMSRNHLHPAQLTEGIMACWNNEFGGALEIFKDNSQVFPRWSLAAAEVLILLFWTMFRVGMSMISTCINSIRLHVCIWQVHIVRQLISGQLSEADSELTDALQLSEKVASRVLDKKTDLVRYPWPQIPMLIATKRTKWFEELMIGDMFIIIIRTRASWDTAHCAVPTRV